MPDPQSADTEDPGVADYHPGGIVTGPESVPVPVTPAPDKCVFAWEHDEMRCRRPDHDHPAVAVITRADVATAMETVLNLCGIKDAHGVAEQVAAELE